MGNWSRVSHYLLPITYYPLPITYYPLPITYYLLPITYYRVLGITFLKCLRQAHYTSIVGFNLTECMRLAVCNPLALLK